MGILRCKMCGAPIEVTENNHLVTCSYCGSKQTIIDANDEKKTNLFNRANQLRMNCDFDSAIAAYESIISLYPQEPEAYWGLALSKFGIEYVDDPKTKKKIPTIHRSSYEHFDRDSNYLRALEYADIVAQEQYKHEAVEITNIQKSILNISKNEKPFDIFICYKESDNEGKRTRDSVIGQELHQLLTDKGYKVFFSRVTLENKLGTMYEPYIFAALNSAKIMIVIGTKKEYFNATWVKNEWSRFLSLMQGRSEKYIIPCYRDMDAYEMPEELLGFQAQDLNKLGFIQDLLRGINKLIGKEENKPTTRVVHTDINIEPMLQRAEILIQDKDYTKADEVLEKILNNDPRNSDAYLLKSVIHNNKTSIDDLKNSDVEPDDTNFKRAYQFADEERKAFLDSIITSIQERRNEESNSKKYNKAIELKNLKNYESAIELFSMIPNYKDSTKLAKECSNLINEEKYNRALGFLSAENYASATALFYGLGDYKDSKLKIEEIEALKQESAYKKAKELLDAGFFKDAKSLLSKIEKYKDSAAILCNIDNLEHEFKCEQIYKSAIIEGEINPLNHLYKLKKSIDVLMTISDYKNATELLTLYEGYYREGLKIQEERKAEQERKRKIRNRKIKIGSLISTILVFIITATFLSTFLYFVPSANEAKLIDLVNERKYKEALNFYNELDNISQNFGKINRLNNLSKAGIAMDARDYETALEFTDYADVETTVHYNGDGGTVDSETQVFKQYITTIPDKRGYDFQGWDLVDFKIDANNLTAEMWLDATYELVNYTISYVFASDDMKNDIRNPKSYTILDEVILKEPTRVGYTFKYWEDQYGNNIKNIIKKGTIGDITLKPVWNDGNEYIVTLDPNGGKVENTTMKVKYNHYYSFPTPEREGYEFDGWYYENLNVCLDSGYWTYVENLTVVAKWIPIKYSITYILNGGTNNPLNPSSYTIEDEIVLKGPIMEGYSFVTWTDNEGENISKIEKGTTGSIILNANWNDGNYYKIELNANGGTVTTTTYYVQYNKDYSLPIPKRKGYDFIGWYEGNTKFLDKGKWCRAEDVNLTAKWELITYSISYRLFGGSNHLSNRSTYNVEEEIYLYDATKVGYSFSGWYKDDKLVTKIEKGTAENLILEAKWSAVKNNLTVYSIDETKGFVEIISGEGYTDELITVKAVPIGDCVFKGRYSDSAKVSSADVYEFIMPANDFLLAALFYTKEEQEKEDEYNWKIDHGIIPNLSDDEETLTYGLYPQNKIDDTSLISILNSLVNVESNGWYFYEGDYYAKTIANSTLDATFDDAEPILNETTYWFKCEPIKWKILGRSNTKCYLSSDCLLDVKKFITSVGNRPISYYYSDVRVWLNNEFYNSAFSLQDDCILTTTLVSNGQECEDKIYLKSRNDYTTDNSNDTIRCKTTEWARVNGAYYNKWSNYLYYGNYWTSTNGGTGDRIYVVDYYGDITVDSALSSDVCVRPSLKIDLSLLVD